MRGVAAATATMIMALASACSEGEAREAEETTVVEESREVAAEAEAEAAAAAAAAAAAEAEAEAEAEAAAAAAAAAAAEAEAEAEAVAVAPELQPVAGEAPGAAVARCEQTSDANTCVVLALDERGALRAQERQRVIEAHRALGNEGRMLDHMEAFLADYPRDRRGNRIRMRLREAGRL